MLQIMLVRRCYRLGPIHYLYITLLILIKSGFETVQHVNWHNSDSWYSTGLWSRESPHSSCSESTFPATSSDGFDSMKIVQALWCVHRRLTMFLHNSGAASARVCLSGLALGSDRRPARDTGVVTEANDFQP